MTFDYKKPFKLADGRSARLLCDNLKGDRPLAVAVEHSKDEILLRYSIDGTAPYEALDCSLINLPERKERWRNVYDRMLSPRYKARYDANHAADKKDRIGLLRIVYENDRVVEQEYFPLHGETE